jgi:hypothetical protein
VWTVCDIGLELGYESQWKNPIEPVDSISCRAIDHLCFDGSDCRNVFKPIVGIRRINERWVGGWWIAHRNGVIAILGFAFPRDS